MKITAGQKGDLSGPLRVKSAPDLQAFGHLFIGEHVGFHQLAATEDGVQNSLLILGDKQENGLFGRLLDEFEQPVTFLTQVLGHPHQQDFIAPFKGFEAEFPEDGVALLFRDVTLLVLRTEPLEPAVRVSIGIFGQRLPPRFEVVGADGVRTDGWKGKVNVGMRKLCGFATGGTNAAGILG